MFSAWPASIEGIILLTMPEMIASALLRKRVAIIARGNGGSAIGILARAIVIGGASDNPADHWLGGQKGFILWFTSTPKVA